MLPRAHRLSDRQDVSRVFRTGRKVYGSLFSFSFLPNSTEQSRFTVVVGKKTFPRAIDRNRLKRLVREALRHALPRITTGYDGALFALKIPIQKPSFENVTTDIESILRKAHLFLN